MRRGRMEDLIIRLAATEEGVGHPVGEATGCRAAREEGCPAVRDRDDELGERG